MNILFVATDDNFYSGAFQCMAKLAELLQQEYGHKILVVLPYNGSGKCLLDEKGIKSIIIPSHDWTIEPKDKRKFIIKIKHFIKLLINKRASNKISRLIRNEHIDIVHINTSFGYVGALSALNCNKPFVWHIQECLEEDMGRQIWNKEKGYNLMRKATTVIAISDFVYKKYLPIIGEKKLVKILDGIDPDAFYFGKHKLFELPKIQLLIIGTVKEPKGQNIAIEACLQLIQRGIGNFRLRIVGKGDLTYIKELMDIVKKYDVQNFIEYCGATENVSEYYKTSDIVLMCSLNEAFGRVTVEAMYSGALVIGADTAATKELIEDGTTGLLFESGNAAALADRIIFAFNHKEEMMEVAKAGQTYMLKNMTAKKNAEHINNLYNKIERDQWA